jgi:MYXO-CTERM domain-containing protein
MSCTSTDNTIGMCVGCVTDANCGSQMSGQVCNGATGMCEPGCRGKDGNGCPTGETCSSKNQMIGMCQQCTTDATCGGPKSGLVCDGATGMCEPGCRGKDGNGCPTNEVCSSTDGSIGTCMNGAGGGGAGPSDGITASGNGLLCAAAPGRDGGDTGWLVGGLLGVLAAARRRRRAQRAAP